MARHERRVRYRVSRGRTSMWDVHEDGVPTPIASFHDRSDAAAYARRLAATRGPGQAQVLIDDAPAPRAA